VASADPDPGSGRGPDGGHQQVLEASGLAGAAPLATAFILVVLGYAATTIMLVPIALAFRELCAGPVRRRPRGTADDGAGQDRGVDSAAAVAARWRAAPAISGSVFYPPSPALPDAGEGSRFGGRRRRRRAAVGLFVDPDDATVAACWPSCRSTCCSSTAASRPARLTALKARFGGR